MTADRAKVAILISGRGSNMEALIAASRAADCPYEVALVFSNRPTALGLDTARAEGIPTESIDHRGLPDRAAYDAEVDRLLRAANIEFVALAGYMRILSTAFVEAWAGRMLNIHPSLLPKYKGLDTYARAIAAGDNVAGCSVHIVTPELDDGPVIAQAEVPVLPDDTPETLAARVLVEEHKLYPAALADWVRGHP